MGSWCALIFRISLWTAGILSLLTVCGLSWEHFARKNNSTFKPSTGFWKAAAFAHDAWYTVGEYSAKISSFIYYLRDWLHDLWVIIKDFFSEFVKTASDYFKPLVELCFSWKYAFEGYFETALTYTYPTLVGLGTVLLLFFVATLVTFVLARYQIIDPSYSIYHRFVMWCRGIMDSVQDGMYRGYEEAVKEPVKQQKSLKHLNRKSGNL
jgi:hypothetical protein